MSLFQATYRNVDHFETPDKYTFVIKLKRFDPELLFFVGAHHGWIVPKEVVQKYGSLKNVAIGSGPFIFDKWIKDVGVFYNKNPDYYMKGKPYVDKYAYLVIADAQTRLTAFRTGQSCCHKVGGQDFKELQKTNPDMQWSRNLETSPTTLGMRYGDPLFDDIRIRKTVVMAINRDTMLKVGYDGDAILRGPISAQHEGWALSQEEQKKYWQYDSAQAKKLLADAGYKQGLTLEMLYDSGQSGGGRAIMETLMEQFKAAAVTIKLDGYERATMRRKQDAGDYKDLVLGSDGQATPEAHLTQNYRCGGNKNMAQLCDPALDKQIDDMASTVDQEERRKKALEIQRFLMQNYYYKVTFGDFYNYAVWQPWVKGYKETFTHFYVNGFDQSSVWLAK